MADLYNNNLLIIDYLKDKCASIIYKFSLVTKVIFREKSLNSSLNKNITFQIRQRMQIQISNLRENFDMVEIRLRSLHSQISSLKNSYASILADENDNAEITTLSQQLATEF